MSSPLSPNLPPPPPLAHSPQFECITPLSSSFLPKCREEPSYSSVHTATLPLLPPLESNYSPTHAHIASLIPQIIYYLFGGMCNDWINVQLHLGLKLGFSNCLGLDILLRDAQAPSAPCTTFSLALTLRKDGKWGENGAEGQGERGDASWRGNDRIVRCGVERVRCRGRERENVGGRGGQGREERIENGPLIWPTVVQEDGTVRLKTYEELSNKEKLQADYDLKATNIVLQGLLPYVYALVNHHKIAKDIWDRVKLLMQEWGKFVTDVKLAKDLHTLNYDQLYAYLEQHEFPQLDLGLAVPTFLPGDDLIACMNKAMAFLSAVFSPHCSSTNNQLRSSSNIRNQATVQDGRVTVQQVQGRQGQNVVGSGSQGNASDQVKQRLSSVIIVKVEGKELDEEQLTFLADPGIADGQVAQTITYNAAF
ncbi:hypothetical protein Tco_1183666 [Tanacetum coccineum]